MILKKTANRNIDVLCIITFFLYTYIITILTHI